jgi:hypothetical protein
MATDRMAAVAPVEVTPGAAVQDDGAVVTPELRVRGSAT